MRNVVLKIVCALSLILTSSATTARATLTLRLSSNNGVTWTTVADGGLGDINAAPGIVTFQGGLTGWLINVTTGVSKPANGSAAAPFLDINTLDVSSPAVLNASLIIQLSDVDFTPTLPAGQSFLAAIGGTTTSVGGNVTYKTFASTANGLFQTTIPLTSQGPFFTPAFNGNAMTMTVPPSAPYSLTLEATIKHPTFGSTSFDAFLQTTLVSLGDYVWRDLNGNGIQDDGNTGVNGVTVKLLNCAGTTVLGTTVTANHPSSGLPGYYLFSGLVPGCYSVQFVAPCGYHFTQMNAPGSTVANDSNADAAGNTAPVTLPPSSTDLTIDAGLLCSLPVFSGLPPSSADYQCLGEVPPPPTVTAADNCNNALHVGFSQTQSTPGSSCNNIITRTWSATNTCGTITNFTQSVVVDDTTGPMAVAPANFDGQCDSDVPAPMNLSAVDNCDGMITVSPTDSAPVPDALGCGYTITRTWVFVDSCGNPTTVSQMIRIKDTTMPVAPGAPADFNGQCDTDIPPMITLTATDNCDGPIMVSPVDSAPVPDATDCGYTITRRWTFTDVCGNSSSVSQTIHIQDTTPPTILTCGPDMTIECPAVPDFTPPTTSDACGTVMVSSSDEPIAGNCGTGGKIKYGVKRTWIATDECGNTATCSQTITVEDTTAPTIIICGADATIECPAVPSFTPPTTMDACGGMVTITFDDMRLDGACPGTYVTTRTWIATDECGNASSCEQTITVVDTTPPVITCPPDEMVACTDPTDPAATGSATATDTCSGVMSIAHSDVVTPGNCVGNYVITRTWTAIDNCDNPATCVQTIRVNDQNPPAVTCPGPVTVSCASAVPPPDPGSVTATDMCSGPATVEFVSDVINPGSCPNRYTITRTYKATDACGTSATCTQTITVDDQTAPALTCPAGVTVSCASQVPASNPGSVQASDNCGGSVTVVFVSDVISAQTCANRYTITRTYRGTDVCGNSATCTQTITVNDTTPPTITSVPPNGAWDCNPANLPTVASVQAQVTATDNCGGTPTIIVTYVDGGTLCSSNRTFTIIAKDACNNPSAPRTVVFTMNCAACVPSAFNLNGNSALDGPDGNVRFFTTNGISVRVTAFSRAKPAGPWATAYLGQYSGGLGVTDSGEGDGSSDRHTVDNIDRDNYVLFEFSQPVVVNRADLGYVVTDSDLRLWIGTFADPFNNHLTLTDAILASCYTEENLTMSAGTRSAVLNTTAVVGNAVIIAAQTGAATSDDRFKIAVLGICKPACQPSAALGNYVWEDINQNGIQDEPVSAGLNGVTVKLLDCSVGETILRTTVTANDANGNPGYYLFGGLAAGCYRVQFVAPAGYLYTTANASGNPQTDSDANATTGKTGNINLPDATTDLSWDAGLYRQCSASICGSVLRDCDASGSGETGLGGVIVKLKNSGGTEIATTSTSANGSFCFGNLAAGTYTVVVTQPTGYTLTGPAGCNHQQAVTLTACQNKVGVNFSYTGTAPSIQLFKTGPTTAVVGQTITYHFKVVNNGNTCFYGGANVYDAMLGGQIWYQSPVVPGEVIEFDRTYVVKATDANPLRNTATATGHPPVGSPVTSSSTWNVTLPPPPPCPNGLVATPGKTKVTLKWNAFSGATSYKVKRSTVSGGPYTIIKSGLTVRTYTDTAVVNGTPYYYVVSAMVGTTESANSVQVCAIPTAGCPSPWLTKDIGGVAAPGGASVTSGTFTLNGSGADIWDGGDEFRYVYQGGVGNCTVVARVMGVQNTDPWAKAGVMIRESLAPDAKHASVFLTPGNGVAFQSRSTTAGTCANINTTGLTGPYWVKIVRTSNTFTAFRSSNGTTWTQIGTVNITMGSSVYIGLGVTSHNDGTLSTAAFSNVTATP